MSASSCSVVPFFSKAYLVSPFLELTHSSVHPCHLCICPLPLFAVCFLRGCNQNFIQYFKMWAFLSIISSFFRCSLICTYYIAYKQSVLCNSEDIDMKRISEN